jgi:tetratricopeptide (TPR) repeat protein
LMERAIGEDSSFAMAWRRLAMWTMNSAAGPALIAKGDTALRRAQALRDRLPERERLLVDAAAASRTDDLDEAIAIYAAILEKYPRDQTALNNIAAMTDRMGRRLEAYAGYKRAIASGTPLSLTYDNALYSAMLIGRMEEADSLLQLFRTARPNSPEPLRAAAYLAMTKLDFGAADSLSRRLLGLAPQYRAVAHRNLATLAQLRGQFRTAASEVRSALRIDQQRGAYAPGEADVLAELHILTRDADYVAPSRARLQQLEALWERNRAITANRMPFARRHLNFARTFAALGDTARARALVAEHLRLMETGEYPVAAARVVQAQQLAYVANRTGHPDEALARLREACAFDPGGFASCEPLSMVEAAEAHDRAGRVDSAIAVYRRFVTITTIRQLGPPLSLDETTPLIAPAYRRLGELLEQKKDVRGAIEAYERFLDFWREADPELQPIVRSVRERTTQLRRQIG